jgi:hypothetical protein
MLFDLMSVSFAHTFCISCCSSGFLNRKSVLYMPFALRLIFTYLHFLLLIPLCILLILLYILERRPCLVLFREFLKALLNNRNNIARIWKIFLYSPSISTSSTPSGCWIHSTYLYSLPQHNPTNTLNIPNHYA